MGAFASKTDNFSFAGAPSGQNLFLTFGTAATQIVVTGKNPADQSAGASITTGNTVNTGQGGGTTTIGVNNQMFDPGEGAYFTFVSGTSDTYRVPNLDQNEADVEANIDFTAFVPATQASFRISQTQPASKDATVKITAFLTDTAANERGVNYVNGLNNDTKITITGVTVTGNSASGTPVVTNNGDGTFTVRGLRAGDVVNYTTTSDHTRVLIENPTGSKVNFDIGGFSITRVTSANERADASFQFFDDGPTATATELTATVDEDGLTGGIAGGTGGVAGEAATATGNVSTLFTSGVDTPLTYSLSTVTTGLPALTSGGVALTYSVSNNVLTASAGGNTVFTFSLNGTTGAYTFTLVKQLDHASGNDENDLTINLSSLIEAADKDGDKVPAGADALIVTVDDDTPTAAIAQAAGTTAHDETAGVDGDADDTTDPTVAALFTGAANTSTDLSPTGYAQNAGALVSTTGTATGADSAGAATTLALEVSSQGVDSGLDTTDGTSIFLFKEGDLVVGRIGADATAAVTGEAAFAVALDGSGVVSVAQYASLAHPTGGASHDESVSITDSALRARVTVTDGDGDTATNTVDIGDAVEFQDDGPSAEIALAGGPVTHDETAGVDGDADDTTDPAVAALFTGVANTSADLSTAGYAQGTAAAVSATGGAGQDEEGATSPVFSLAVSAAGVDSGLDTTDGQNILLYKEGDLVVGRIGSAAGAAAFAVAIGSGSGSGVLSVAQYASLAHPTGGASHDESISIDNGALLAVAVQTDGDGDTASSSIGIGSKVAFQDDGPALETGSNTIDDGLIKFVNGATNTDGKFTDSNLGLDYGEDGQGSLQITSYEAMPDNTVLGTITETRSSNDTVLTYSSATYGDLFRLTLDQAEPGGYTFEALRDPPTVVTPLGGSAFGAAGPSETKTATTSSGTTVTANGYLIQSSYDPSQTIEDQVTNFPGSTPADSVDDVNTSTQGIGIKDNQIDLADREVVALSFSNPVDAASVVVDGPTGGFAGATLRYEAYLGGSLVFTGSDTVSLPNGGSQDTVVIDEGLKFDEVYVFVDGTKGGLRINRFEISEKATMPDFSLDYTVTATDGDGDTTSGSFKVDIDGNSDGQIISPLAALVANDAFL